MLREKANSERADRSGECIHRLRYLLQPGRRTSLQYISNYPEARTFPMSVERTRSTDQVFHLLSTPAEWRAGYAVAVIKWTST